MKESFEKLYDLEEKIKRFRFFYSLNPLVVKPRGPSELIVNYLMGDSSTSQYIKDALPDLYLSQNENFPLNIFWDMDYFIFSLSKIYDYDYLKKTIDKIFKLNEYYGKKKEINFSYTHDFHYGYDWFRWVQKEPKKRSCLGPYSLEFLDYLEKRSFELCDLIKQNDGKYPKLAEAKKRNPFTFCREFNSEIRLHLALAELDFIPIKAWLGQNITFSYFKDYSEIRQQYSRTI